MIYVRGTCGVNIQLDEERRTQGHSCPNPAVEEGCGVEEVRRVCAQCSITRKEAKKLMAQDFKAGDKVKVVDPHAQTPYGDEGTVEAVDTSAVLIGFEQGRQAWYLPAELAVMGAAVEPPVIAEADKVVVTGEDDPRSAPRKGPEISAEVVVAPAPAQPDTIPMPDFVPEGPKVALEEGYKPYEKREAHTPSAFIPGLVLDGLSSEDAIDLEAIMAEIPEIEGGPSSGGFSWHTLADCQQCWRKAYLAHVRGIQWRGSRKALTVGTMVHACFEAHYRSGGKKTFELCDKVAAAGAPQIAGEVRRYVYAYLQHYGEEEAQTWDVRGLETQSTWWMPEMTIEGRKVQIPLTCRHDMLISKRDIGSPCAPAGPAPNGIYIVDIKTAKALTYDLIHGYGRDGQFLMNALLYRRGESEKNYGKLLGVAINLIAKHKKMDPAKSLQRTYTMTDEATVDEFYEQEIKPLAIEFYGRLANPEVRNDMNKWPKKSTSCVGRYGMCPYFDICDTSPGGEEAIIESLFEVDESRIKDIDSFLLPPKPKKKAAALRPLEKATPLEAKPVIKTKKQERAEAKEAVLLATVDAMRQLPQMQPEHWTKLSPKQVEVNKLVATYLADGWTEGTEIPLKDAETGKDIFVVTTKKSLKWVARGFKSSLAWSVLAKRIVAPWYDSSKTAPAE